MRAGPQSSQTDTKSSVLIQFRGEKALQGACPEQKQNITGVPREPYSSLRITE